MGCSLLGHEQGGLLAFKSASAWRLPRHASRFETSYLLPLRSLQAILLLLPGALHFSSARSWIPPGNRCRCAAGSGNSNAPTPGRLGQSPSRMAPPRRPPSLDRGELPELRRFQASEARAASNGQKAPRGLRTATAARLISTTCGSCDPFQLTAPCSAVPAWRRRGMRFEELANRLYGAIVSLIPGQELTHEP